MNLRGNGKEKDDTLFLNRNDKKAKVIDLTEENIKPVYTKLN
jgi:hypothetical protein